jgi:hypothetical protein
MAGADNPQNLGINLSLRELLEKGKKAIEVVGPFDSDTEEDEVKHGQGGFEATIAELSKAYF